MTFPTYVEAFDARQMLADYLVGDAFTARYIGMNSDELRGIQEARFARLMVRINGGHYIREAVTHFTNSLFLNATGMAFKRFARFIKTSKAFAASLSVLDKGGRPVAVQLAGRTGHEAGCSPPRAGPMPRWTVIVARRTFSKGDTRCGSSACST